jgi:hypothetical protein
MLIAKVNGSTIEGFSFYGTTATSADTISVADHQFLTSISSLPVVSELPYNTATETLVPIEPVIENGIVYTVKVVPTTTAA